jgi:hypothetical protein
MERYGTPIHISRYNGGLAETINHRCAAFDYVLPHTAAEPGQTQ